MKMLIGVKYITESGFVSSHFTWGEGMRYYGKEKTTYHIYVEKPEEITIDQWRQIQQLTPKNTCYSFDCDDSWETTYTEGSDLRAAKQIAQKLGPDFVPTDDLTKLSTCELAFSPHFVYQEPIIKNFPIRKIGITLSLPDKVIESSKLPINESNLRQTGLYIRKLIISEGVTSFKAIGYASYKYIKPLTHAIGKIDLGQLGHHSDTISIREELSLDNYSWPDYCISIEEIVFPKSLQALPERAFQNFTNLEKIHFSEGLRVVPCYAFTGCSKLSEIVLPKSITKICRGAFSNCSELKRIAVPYTLVDVDCQSFEGCNNIEFVVVYKDDKHGYKTSLKDWLYNLRKS